MASKIRWALDEWRRELIESDLEDGDPLDEIIRAYANVPEEIVRQIARAWKKKQREANASFEGC